MTHLFGLCTLTDLLDAQAQWQQARSNLIEAETQYKIYGTEYLRVTGRLYYRPKGGVTDVINSYIFCPFR